MKRIFLLLVFCVPALLVGCSERAVPYQLGDGMVNTRQDREHIYVDDFETLAKQFIDDFDVFWLADQPSHLSYWHARGAGRGVAAGSPGLAPMTTHEPPRW